MPATGIAALLPAGLKSRLFEGIAPRNLEIIRAAATERRLLANSVITNQGSPAEHLFLLTSGRARYFFIAEEGQKTLLLWLPQGEIIGGAAFLSKASNYLLSAETVKDSSVRVWTAPQFETSLRGTQGCSRMRYLWHPTIWPGIWSIMQP